MKITITNHAKERMDTYDLSEETVKNAIINPDEIVNGYKERLIAHKAYNNNILRVIYEKTIDDEIIIITVYPALKKRYGDIK